MADIKVFTDIKMIVADRKSDNKNALKTEWVKEEIELKWSDRFWLFFLKYYAKVMESMIPFVSSVRCSPLNTTSIVPVSMQSVILIPAGSQTSSRIDRYSRWRQRHSNVLHPNHYGRDSKMDPVPTFSHVQSMVDMVHIHPNGVCTPFSHFGKS